MQKKLTRREMAAGLMTASPVLSAATGSRNSGSARDTLATARQQIRDSAGELEKFELPMSTEPAFIFKP